MIASSFIYYNETLNARIQRGEAGGPYPSLEIYKLLLVFLEILVHKPLKKGMS